MMAQHGFFVAPGEIEQLMTAQPQPNRKPGLQNPILSSIDGANTATDEVLDTFHAGQHITEIYELLEMCLLELPVQDLLLAQRVSRRFNAVINTSPRLREKLFFTSRLAFGNAFKAKLNPLMIREDVMRAIPLFFDHKEKRLACCYQEGYTRLYCRSITATTVWVYLEFCDEQASLGQSGEERPTETLERGSWERMFISQPSCFVSWRVQMSSPVQETYYGIVKGARTMGSLLDGMVESLVVRQR